MNFRSLKTSFRILFLILFSTFHLISCQNCGVPKTVNVKQSDQLTETLDTGQILTTISVFNVKHVKSLPVNPNGFASAYFDSNMSQLVLKVDTPFWSIENPEGSFIDKYRLVNVRIDVALECNDGREKSVTFNLPIRDENTQKPVFEKPTYQVVTEPCMAERCMMIFDADVIVMDRDRDELNAKVDIYTTSKDIEVLGNFTSIEPWINNTNNDSAKQIGYLTKVRLGVTSKTFPLPKTISFQLVAKNIQPYVESKVFLAETNVTISFEEFSGKTLPPIFSNPFYYTNFNGFEDLEIRPSAIKAVTPWDISDSSIISYRILGAPNIFIIDPGSGHIKFNNKLDKSIIPKDCTINYTIIAQRTKLGLTVNDTSKAYANASFLVIFPTSISPPDHTDPTCSPECYTTPWPGTCPEPEPCPGTTTETPGTNVTTSTIFPTWSTETVTWSTGTVTEVTEIPTTEMLTTELPTESPITPPPVNCSCNCEDFTCKAQYESSVEVMDLDFEYFADPYNCTIYHSCKNGNEHGHIKHTCLNGTIYCPNLKTCTTIKDCQEASKMYSLARYGYGNGDGSSSEDDPNICTNCTCNERLEPEDENNLCNEYNFLNHIPDPHYCDIFHQCQPLTIKNGRNFITLMDRYYDIPMKCDVGLIFCKKYDVCVPPGHEGCEDACPYGKVKQCDVCMGNWKNFDIFTQRFTK